jgi:hypothetical protein
MTRKAWRKRPGAEKVPEEVEAFIFLVFLELEIGAESIEEAVLIVARSGRSRATGVAKLYIRQVEAHEHDAILLDLVWKRAARRGGYIVEGDARGFLLEVQKVLKRSLSPGARSHHKPRKT